MGVELVEKGTAMKRSVSTVFLIAFLTLGFLGLFGIYLPGKILPAQPDQVIAAPVSIASFSEIADPQEPAGTWDEARAAAVPAEEPGETAAESPPAPEEKKAFIPLDVNAEAAKYSLVEYSPLPEAPVQKYTPRFYPSPPLKRIVEFWRNVFARYGQHQSVVHDARNLEIIYGVLDFSDLYSNPKADPREIYRIRRICEERKKGEIREILSRFAAGQIPLTPWENKVLKLFQKFPEYPFRKGMENVRAQWGQSDRFQAGLIRFGRYQHLLEEIFRREGVPAEISRLTFVESMFTNNAVSKVGAAGPWQFMPYTAKEYLWVNDYVDQRYDPLLAGAGAARLLKKNFELLGSWPAAINAYNTGAMKLLKAKRRLGTDDIATTILYFDDPGYQFASRNFYPEFLAALQVVGNYKDHFGRLKLQSPASFEEIVLPFHTSLSQLAQTLATDVSILKELNPSYHDKYFLENAFVPRGYVIRIPGGQKRLYLAAMDQMHQQEKDFHWHVVGRRETLPKIAGRYKIPSSLLMEANGLLDPKVKEGQILKIPGVGETLVLESR